MMHVCEVTFKLQVFLVRVNVSWSNGNSNRRQSRRQEEIVTFVMKPRNAGKNKKVTRGGKSSIISCGSSNHEQNGEPIILGVWKDLWETEKVK